MHKNTHIILIISNFAHFFLSLLHLQNHRPHYILLPLIHTHTHTLPQTQNQKSTTKIKNKPKINNRHHKTKHTHTRTHQRSQREWIGACGRSACLDQSFIEVCLDQSAWIGILLAVLRSEFFSPCLNRSFKLAPCLDRSFKWKFQISI